MSLAIIREDADSSEIIKKEEEYVDYINNHISLVQKAYKELFVDNMISIPDVDDDTLNATIKELAPAIETHDASKFGDEEFPFYREKFYPTKFELDKANSDPSYVDYLKEEFQKAFEHHYLVNDHHPQHWKCENGHFQENMEPKDMTLGAIIHMLCDWQAMSWQEGENDPVDWYNNRADKEKACMSDHTKMIVEEFLKALYGDA